jgi:hypothetical protein
MKPLHVFRWFMSAAMVALLPLTVQTTAAQTMGGGHGSMRMAPDFSNVRAFGHFDHRHDFAFRHHGGDRFFFHRQNRFFFGSDFAAFGFPWWSRIPIPTTTGTFTIIPLMTTDHVTITGIGPLWPCQCNRNLPGAAINMALLTG